MSETGDRRESSLAASMAVRFRVLSRALLRLAVVALVWACRPPGEPAAQGAAEPLTTSPTDAVPESAAIPGASARHLTGPDGAPLPFTTDEQVLAFLETAEIVDMRPIPGGVTESRVVTLEADGVRARAAFHKHHIVRERQRLVDGSVILFFRDSYLNQPAAYEVARLLGMTNTPPTVLRQIDGVEGSLQLWIESAMTEHHRRDEGIEFPDREAAYHQVYDMDVFDALINNRDRSQPNFLWDREWQLWMIDHTRAFGAEPAVVDRRSVRRCSHRLWQRLQTLDPSEVHRVLEPYMDEPERSALLARRDDLVRMIRDKIDSEGEGEVLFEYDDP